MFFLGYTMCEGMYTADCTPTYLNNVKKVRITNSIVDTFYLSKDVSDPEEVKAKIPELAKWDYNTILNAPFNGNLLGGNVNFTADQIHSIRIKRALADSYKWLTLFDIPISANGDLSFTRIDSTNRGDCDYKYALVPVWNDNIEGNYNINTIHSEFEGLWLEEKDMSVNALLNLEIQTQKNFVTSTVMPIGRKHPYVFKYGQANYTTGSFHATFISFNSLEKDWDLEHAVSYRESIDDFLTNGCPKIIKHQDGRIWLAAISDSITKDESAHYQMPVYSITFTSVGEPESSKDLYDANIIDVDYERGVNDNGILSFST